MAQTEDFIALSCDDSYLSLLATGEQLQHNDSLMSDAEYAEELQFQEAIMSSIIFSNTLTNPCSSTNNGLKKEKGESSQTTCEICTDKKDNTEIVSVLKCAHCYCTDCVGKHIAIRVQKSVLGITPTFNCPGLDCKAVLEIDSCRGILPGYVLSMWDDAICEAMVDSSQKFYCPYKDCSGLILNDGGEVIMESECPFCHRLFCAQCKVPWHSGFQCKELMGLNENERSREDLMVHELAKKEKWQRCPRCKFFVEKKDGCLHMTCRCCYQFCYACGATWSSTHGGCQ